MGLLGRGDKLWEDDQEKYGKQALFIMQIEVCLLPGNLPLLGLEEEDTFHKWEFPYKWMASLVAQLVKNPPATQETTVGFLGWEDPLEKGTATHSSIVAWRIPWTV